VLNYCGLVNSQKGAKKCDKTWVRHTDSLSLATFGRMTVTTVTDVIHADS